MSFPHGSVFAPAWSDREALVAFRDDQLRKVVAHAYEHVPHYRRLFDEHGLAPGDVHTADDLHRVPITEREEVQELTRDDLVTPGADDDELRVVRTSGSSGRPVTIRLDQEEGLARTAVRLRQVTYHGMRPTEPRADVGLAGYRGDSAAASPLGRLYPSVIVDARLPPGEILETLREASPRVITGYPGVLNEVATLVPDGDDTFDVRFVLLGGEVLTPLMRDRIERAFGAPVYEYYGAWETGPMTEQCHETGLHHVMEDAAVLEVLADGEPVGPGESGESVVTALHSFTQPFLRYRLGDLVTRGPERCPCGAPWSTIESIQGRMLDYFVLPDGRRVHPYGVTAGIVGGNRWIRQYRLVQERMDRVVLRMVCEREPDPEDIERIVAQMQTSLGPDVEVEVERVDHLGLEASGKFRIARSEVQSEYARGAGDETP